MDFNTHQRDKINALFTDFESSNLTYVVPRGHQQLPHRTPGGDIDFIILPDHFDKAITIAEELGFHPKKLSRLRSIVKLGKKGILAPQTAFAFVINSPTNALKMVSDHVLGTPTTSHNSPVSDWRAHNGEVMIHLRNHLAYKSPWQGGEYRIHPDVEDQFFGHRKTLNGMSIPQAPDELAHLICRGVFDKEGQFPEYYENRCNELFNHMNKSEKNRFRELLSLIFFNADDFVFQKVVNGEYRTILSDLKTYTNY